MSPSKQRPGHILKFDTSNKYNLIYTLCSILAFIQQTLIKLLILSKHNLEYMAKVRMRNFSFRILNLDHIVCLDIPNKVLRTWGGNT